MPAGISKLIVYHKGWFPRFESKLYCNESTYSESREDDFVVISILGLRLQETVVVVPIGKPRNTKT